MLPRIAPADPVAELESLEPRLCLAGDHPSLADFPTATLIPMIDNPAIETSVGRANAVIGTLGDDDLFRFVAPYSGRAAIVVAQSAVGGLAPAIQLFSYSGSPFSVLTDGRHGVASVIPVVIENLVAGETYYINARAGTPSDTDEPATCAS
jgi:hypothetical protein